MAAGNRYQVESSEGEFQPGSDGLVLRNRLGITTQEDMNELELSLLALKLWHRLCLRIGQTRLIRQPDRIFLLVDQPMAKAAPVSMESTKWRCSF